MSRLIKKLLAADRQQKLERAGKKLGKWFDSTKPEPVNPSTMDYIKFAEQYMGHVDKETGEYVPMKFTDADRYLFEQLHQAENQQLSMMLYPGRMGRWPQYVAGIDAIDGVGKDLSSVTTLRKGGDGEEYHVIKHEPWEEPFLAQHALDSRRAFKVVLDKKSFPPPSVEFGKLQIPRSEVSFDRQEGNQVFLTFPYDDKKVTISFLDQSTLWSIFPEIGKQLGKI